MSILNIRTAADFRAFVHVAAPVVSASLVASQIIDLNVATLAVGLVLALASPALAAGNSADARRTAIYALLGAVSAIVIFLGYITEADYANWLPVITLLLGGGVAAANTPTTIDGSVESVHDTEIG